jgi:hypothetical protein
MGNRKSEIGNQKWLIWCGSLEVKRKGGNEVKKIGGNDERRTPPSHEALADEG